MASIAEHAAEDIGDRRISDEAAAAAYHPSDERCDVVNASAYRAVLLMSAAQQFARDDYRTLAERNLEFVLAAQLSDGSWPYAVDGVRPFIDHYHTCFVLKALGKLERLTGDERLRWAIEAGVAYYVETPFRRGRSPQALRARATPHCVSPGTLRLRGMHQPSGSAAWVLSDFRRASAVHPRRHPSALAQARRLVSISRAIPGVGRSADASLGAIAAL